MEGAGREEEHHQGRTKGAGQKSRYKKRRSRALEDAEAMANDRRCDMLRVERSTFIKGLLHGSMFGRPMAEVATPAEGCLSSSPSFSLF